MSRVEDEIVVLERLRSLCSKSEKCIKDLSDKLNQWRFEGDIPKIINILVEEGFINEHRYAQSFVNDKIKFGKWGRNKIKYHLKQKGILTNYIELAIEKIEDSEYFEIAEKEILKKNKLLKSNNQYDRKKKLYSFAIQRGYESDMIIQIIEKILKS